MSEDRRRRGIRRTLGAGALGTGGQPRPGRVGEPNVLSDAAIPNRLSTEVARPTGILSGTREAVPGWVPPSSLPPGSLPPGSTTPQRRIRIPSLATLLFLGFLALTAFRLVGEFVGSFPSAEPAATNAAPVATSPDPGSTGTPAEPGAIAFGTASDGECGVTGEGFLFAEGTDVWWSAQLSAVQAAGAGAVVVVKRNEREIDRQAVPPDPSLGEWDVLCSTDPVAQHIGGSYRVEVWDDNMAVMLAAGNYRLST